MVLDAPLQRRANEDCAALGRDRFPRVPTAGISRILNGSLFGVAQYAAIMAEMAKAKGVKLPPKLGIAK